MGAALVGCGCSASNLLVRLSKPSATPTKTSRPVSTATLTPTVTPTPTHTPLPTNTPTPTPLPTNTPIVITATSTPLPTNTPVPPTNTPKPKPRPTATPTRKPEPSPTPKPQLEWSGAILETFSNCGMTRVFGFTLDKAGSLAGDVWVHYWSNDWAGGWVKSLAYDFGASTTWKGDEGNWEGILDKKSARENTWHVCVVPSQNSTTCISNMIDFATDSHCRNGVQVVWIRFQKN
jgi:hypothetical protein